MTEEVESIINGIYDKFDEHNISEIPNVLLETLFSKIQALNVNKTNYKKFFIDTFINKKILFRDLNKYDIDDDDCTNNTGSVEYDTDNDTDSTITKPIDSNNNIDNNDIKEDTITSIDDIDTDTDKIKHKYGDSTDFTTIDCKRCIFNFKINKIGTHNKIIQLAYLQLDVLPLMIITYNFDNGHYTPNDLCEESEDIFNSTKVPIDLLKEILIKLRNCETIYVFNKKLVIKLLNENFKEHKLSSKMICLREGFESKTIFDINDILLKTEPINTIGTITDSKKVSSNYVRIMYEICKFNGFC